MERAHANMVRYNKTSEEVMPILIGEINRIYRLKRVKILFSSVGSCST